MKEKYLQKIAKAESLIKEAKHILETQGVTNRVHDIMIAEISEVFDIDKADLTRRANSRVDSDFEV